MPERAKVKETAEGKKEQIVYADRQMIPELVELWMEAFGDDREYAEFYFANRFSEETLLVYLNDGRPVSMISMLPAYLRVQGKRLSIRYIYAVATRKTHRGRGYAAELLKEGYRLLGVPFVLEPATEQLISYYCRLGFRKAFYVDEYELIAPQTGKVKPDADFRQEQERAVLRAAELILSGDEARTEAAGAPGDTAGTGVERGMTVSFTDALQKYWLLTVTPAEYRGIRDKILSGEGYVEWEEAAIAYALLENDYCGGFAYKVFHDGQEDILLYRMEENHMKIIETTLTDSEISGVLAKLRIAPKRVTVRRPVTSAGSRRSFGLILGADALEKGYLNLTLE